MVQNLNIGQFKIVNRYLKMENDAQALYHALVCINKIIPNLLHRFLPFKLFKSWFTMNKVHFRALFNIENILILQCGFISYHTCLRVKVPPYDSH